MVYVSQVSRMEVANALRGLLDRHRGRADFALNAGISVSESLRNVFDEYVRIVLNDLREQIRLLESVGRELEKEKLRLRELSQRFERTNDRLIRMLEVAKKREIRGITLKPVKMPTFPKLEEEEEELPVKELELDVIIEGFRILGELEELREDVERWSRTYVRDIEDLLSIIDERLRGAGSP